MSIPFFKCKVCGRYSHDENTNYICDECRHGECKTGEDSLRSELTKEEVVNKIMVEQYRTYQKACEFIELLDKQHYGVVGVRSNVGSPDKPKHSD